MENFLCRLEMLYGKNAIEKLNNSRVAIFGVGGVGGYVAEALARSGIGAIDIFDSDSISISNLNRQIIAVRDTIGMDKTSAAAIRIRSINPSCKVREQKIFYSPDNEEQIDLGVYDYIADAIDFIPGKISLAVRCEREKIPIISAMGAGNKIHPQLLKIADIYQTSVCPLARTMRRELRKRGVKKLLTVYSEETPVKPEAPLYSQAKQPPASCVCVPGCMGLIMAQKIINDLALQKIAK